MEKELQMDFEFFQFQKEDYHDVKQGLRFYLNGEVFELEELSDELIEQFYVGSTIKVNDGENFVGMLSAFNITHHSSKASVQSIKNWMLTKIASNQDKAALTSLLNGDKGNVALIISERIESVPVQLTPHLYTQLYTEIEKAYQQEKVKFLKLYSKKLFINNIFVI